MAEPPRIAIVGSACRLPGAADVEAFGELLWSGRDAIGEVPEERFSKARFFHPEPGRPGKTYTFAAGCLPGIWGFDNEFFGVSPREAASIDPQQRLLLELAYEAMEDAGIGPSRLAGTPTGVYVGGSSWDFAAHSFLDAAALDSYAMQGAALSSLANRLSYLFNLKGPSLTVDTACSSSLVALHLACEALRRGEIGTALVGGVNLLVTPQSFVGFARATMLSPRGRCRPFDAAADGYVRAEGGVVLMLKMLAHAESDGDRILGIIRATGVNQDGRTNGFSLPNGHAQAALLRRVYDEAGIDPEALSYFEAHGTGTAAGDPIEAHAIGEALGKRRGEKLPIGSVKSNIGHLEPASGLAGVLKVLLSFARGSVPASLNFTTPNPHIPFAELNLDVVTRERPYGAQAGERLVGVNSFGFGGTNAHVVLAAPAAVAPPPANPASAAPLLLSARGTAALRALAQAWRDRLANVAKSELPPLLCAAAQGREHHAHRLAIAGGTSAEMAARLDAFLADEQAPGAAMGQAEPGALAFVFSGNGSQWAGMAREALATSAAFREGLARVEALLAPTLGWSVAERLADPALAEALPRTEIAQPLLFAIQVASVMALAEHGVRAGSFAGHSVGEVAAAWAAGALTLADACRIIVQRSVAQGATHGAGRMAVLGLDAKSATALFAREGLALVVAADNARQAITAAGPLADLERLRGIALAEDWPFSLLDLDYAFHSPAMEPARAPFLAALGRVEAQAPRGLLVSSVTGEAVAAGALDALYWWHNVRDPVLFRAAMDRLVAGGARLFLEIGPQPVLQSYLREALQRGGKAGRVLLSLSRVPAGIDPFAAIAAACYAAGADLTGAPALAGPRVAEGLPRYPWQHQEFRPARTVEGLEIDSPVREHPLLGFRDPAAPFAWNADLSTALEPWLADHQVDGSVVLPAAAMIDMALAAARAHHPDAAVLELQDLEIARPLVLEPGSERSSHSTLDGHGWFELASRKRLGTEAMIQHARCRIVASQRRAPIGDWNEPADVGTPIPAEAVYATASSLRLHYGPAFRSVAEVRRARAGDSLALLVPPALDRVALGYLLDPALLDGCLQALLALIADTELAADSMVMPWRFGRVRLWRPQGAGIARARLRPRRAGPRSVCADIALLDDAGECVGELLECWFVAVPRGAADSDAMGLWTEYVPSLRQPIGAAPAADSGRHLAEVVAALPEPAPAAEETRLLAEACLAATAWEALRAQPGGDAALDPATLAPHQRAALDWLAADGLATPADGRWQLAADPDLPPACELWRTLFFDLPEAPAENALLAAAIPWLADAGGDAAPALPPALREQALLASPAAHGAIAGLLAALDAACAGRPAGSVLRVALAGMAGPALGHRLGAWARGRGLRLLAVTMGADTESLRGRFDVVLGLFALSGEAATRVTPDAAMALLAPGGVLLLAEPAESRTASLLFGATALQSPEAWCAHLCEAGADAAASRALDSRIWPVALIAASAAGGTPAAPEASDMVVFTAPDDPLATAIAAHQAVPRLLPIEALADVLRAVVRGEAPATLILVPPVAAEAEWAEALPELLAGLAAALAQSPRGARLWLVSRGSPEDAIAPAAMAGLSRVVANEWPELDCRALALDPGLSAEAAAERVLCEVAQPDDEREAWWTEGGRLVPRLRLGMPPAPLAHGPRRLEVTRPGLVSSLAWTPAEPPAPGPGEVAIAVAAAALNFRDVMWAQGLLPDEALLDGFSGASLGLECAGTVTEVGEGVAAFRPGDRVVAVAPAALATHVVTPEAGVMALPQGLDDAAGATIPVAFMTAVYALGHLARLAPGERVLIHGGAGAVGLAAIQYALHKGAEVYATAGAPARRATLAQLGVAGVFDSRSTRFAEDLLAAAGGEGVDVVLNSLAGELMQESLRLLRPFGRFVEIGKRDLYANTLVGIRPLRHNVSYFAIDTDELVARRPAAGRAVLDEVQALFAAGTLRPLPYRCFGFAEAVDAFRLLQASGHVGKVVLRPEPTPSAPARAAIARDGVYVVSGGLAGFGLEAARFLARQGARSLALLGRRGAATPGAAEALAALAEAGVDARAFACDVADEAPLAQVLNFIRRDMGPIVGVLHAAMVLDDARLADLDAARFSAVLRPKLAGALALDRLTQDDKLGMFVLFSSVTTAIGTPGQASYVAANSALEALAGRRRAEGRPALAVQWGPIGDAGYLTREGRVGEMLERMLGGAHLTAAAALDALPRLLATGQPVVGLADVAWGALRERLPGLDCPAWAELPSAARGEGGARRREAIADMPPEAALATLVEVLTEALSGILKLPAAAIHADRPVVGFGVDSLMAVELRTAVEAAIGVQVPLLALTADTTLKAMAERLRQLIQSGGVTDNQDLADAILRHEGVAVERLPAAGK